MVQFRSCQPDAETPELAKTQIMTLHVPAHRLNRDLQAGAWDSLIMFTWLCLRYVISLLDLHFLGTALHKWE